MNCWNGIGRLTKEPEMRVTQGGTAVTRFTIAVDRRTKDNKTDFIRCTAFKGTAEFISKYFRKGQMIAVNGRLQIEDYTDNDGNKRTAANIIAENVFFCGSKNDSSKAQDITADEVTTDGFAELEDVDGDLPF